MRSTAGLNRIGITIQGLFLIVFFQKRKVGGRGDMSIYMFAHLKLGFAWMIIL